MVCLNPSNHINPQHQNLLEAFRQRRESILSVKKNEIIYINRKEMENKEYSKESGSWNLFFYDIEENTWTVEHVLEREHIKIPVTLAMTKWNSKKYKVGLVITAKRYMERQN